MRKLYGILYTVFYALAFITLIGALTNFTRIHLNGWWINLIFDLAFSGGCWALAKWFGKKRDRLEEAEK